MGGKRRARWFFVGLFTGFRPCSFAFAYCVLSALSAAFAAAWPVRALPCAAFSAPLLRALVGLENGCRKVAESRCGGETVRGSNGAARETSRISLSPLIKQSSLHHQIILQVHPDRPQHVLPEDVLAQRGAQARATPYPPTHTTHPHYPPRPTHFPLAPDDPCNSLSIACSFSEADCVQHRRSLMLPLNPPLPTRHYPPTRYPQRRAGAVPGAPLRPQEGCRCARTRFFVVFLRRRFTAAAATGCSLPFRFAGGSGGVSRRGRSRLPRILHRGSHHSAPKNTARTPLLPSPRTRPPLRRGGDDRGRRAPVGDGPGAGAPDRGHPQREAREGQPGGAHAEAGAPRHGRIVREDACKIS